MNIKVRKSWYQPKDVWLIEFNGVANNPDIPHILDMDSLEMCRLITNQFIHDFKVEYGNPKGYNVYPMFNTEDDAKKAIEEFFIPRLVAKRLMGKNG
jgi:hypothetical protein